jgi:Cdc6-like AAA superfamily ATPase
MSIVQEMSSNTERYSSNSLISDYSTILGRTTIQSEITEMLNSFEERCFDNSFKKGIYIYGPPGAGKTHFVVNLLKNIGYDVITYDAGDIRNKALVDTITSNNISNRNVLDMMKKKVKKIAIVMDEIDGMNNGDKGGINALIKLIRQKKTQKQRLENVTLNPIICIGNYNMDKKIRELMKVCHTFELKAPSKNQIELLLQQNISRQKLQTYNDMLVNYIQGDIRKLDFVVNLYKNKSHLINHDILENIFQVKSYNEDSKRLTATLLNEYIPFKDHNTRMNDTDRTVIALLWHENLADAIRLLPQSKQLSFYVKILDNMCFADYIDRITFQNQIWLFNEMSSLIKTFFNNKLYHEMIGKQSRVFKHDDIRFTKVLTKYSTEFNNQTFLTNMCLELNMDKKDMITFFHDFRTQYLITDTSDILSVPSNCEHIVNMFDGYNISKLDVRRIYRFLDKTSKRDSAIITDECIEE